jgi:hypothetical protein
LNIELIARAASEKDKPLARNSRSASECSGARPVRQFHFVVLALVNAARRRQLISDIPK